MTDCSYWYIKSTSPSGVAAPDGEGLKCNVFMRFDLDNRAVSKYSFISGLLGLVGSKEEENKFPNISVSCGC